MFITFTQENGFECSVRPDHIVGVADASGKPDESILLLSNSRGIGVRMARQQVLDYIHLVERGSQPADARAFVMRPACFICSLRKPADAGGLQSTGDIEHPVMRWICNDCLRDKVCP